VCPLRPAPRECLADWRRCPPTLLRLVWPLPSIHATAAQGFAHPRTKDDIQHMTIPQLNAAIQAYTGHAPPALNKDRKVIYLYSLLGGNKLRIVRY